MRFLASVTVLATLVGVTPALANRPGFEFSPSVHVAVSGVESQAQLISQLKSEGYKDIQLSDFSPNMDNPQPQCTSPAKALTTTPVHSGWNGTAYRAGKQYNVYVDR